MKKVLLSLFCLILVSSVFAVSDRSDYKVINPEKPRLLSFLTAITGYTCTDFNRDALTTPTDFRDSIYYSCAQQSNDYQVVGAEYDNANKLSKLSCCVKDVSLVIPKTTPSPTTAYKGIGESCNSVSECGSACDGFGSGYSPRCMDGGNGKLCFCGTSNGVYSTVCAVALDCPLNEKCVKGVCTDNDIGNTGNPTELNEGEIKEIIDTNPKISIKSCTDGTDVFMCSPDKPYYCDKDNGLVKKPEICGCPSGQKLDWTINNMYLCCKEDGSDCLSGGVCTNNFEIKQDCPDGSKITIKKCEDNTWVEYSGVCRQEGGNNLIIYLIVGAIIGLLIGGGAGLAVGIPQFGAPIGAVVGIIGGYLIYLI